MGSAVADGVEGVSVAVAHQGQSQLGGEAGRRGSTVAPRRGGVEALERVPVDERVGREVDAHDGVPAHAQAESRERMRNDGQPALFVDLGDCDLRALVAPDPVLQEEAQHVPVSGGDFLAHDHLHPAAAFCREALALYRGLDTLVVADGDNVERGVALRELEDLGRRGRAIRGDRMDVHVGLAHSGPFAGIHAVLSLSRICACSRSGQIGWKSASHCSGASRMNPSKSRASSRAMARIRSRRLAPSGTGTCRRLPR